MSLLKASPDAPSTRWSFLARIPKRAELKERMTEPATVIFWFLVMTSWLPMIAGLQDVLIRLRLGSGPDVFAIKPDAGSFFLIAMGILITGLFKFKFIAVLCMLPAMMAVLLGVQNLGSLNDYRPWLFPLGLCFVTLSALFMVIHGRLRSPAVGMFLLLAAIEAIGGFFPLAPEEGSPPANPAAGQTGASTPAVFLTFGRLFHAYHLSVLDLLIVSSLIVFGRFLVLLYRHNKPGWDGLRGNIDLVSVGKQTLMLSIPFFVMILSLGWFWNQVGSRAEAYAISVLRTPGAPGATLPAMTLEEALVQANDREQKVITDRTNAALAEATAKAQASSTDFVKTIMPNVRASFPPYLMRLSRCGFFDVLCYVMNGIKSVVNSIYRKARDAALNSLEAELREVDKYNQGQLVEKRDRATKAILAFSQESKKWAQTAIYKAFETARWLGLILTIYAAMVAVKSVMVIMSRIIYRDDRSNPHFASLKPGEVSPRFSSPGKGQAEIEIPAGAPDTYVALRYEIRNAVANVSLPQFGTGIISRLFSGRYILGRLAGSSIPEEGASIVVNAPSELLEWNLKKGEEIIVRYEDLVAFSSTVKLATEINLSLQATLFGRFIFHKIIGPGVVIMQTEGEAVAGKEREADESRRATSLKAWQLQAGFQVQSNLNWRGVYLAPFNIRKQEGAMLIYDAGPKNSRWSSLGLIKSVRTFLLPF